MKQCVSLLMMSINKMCLCVALFFVSLAATANTLALQPSRRSSEGSVCDTSLNQWVKYAECAGTVMMNSSSLTTLLYSQPRTKQAFQVFLKELCGEIMPAAQTCVLDDVSGCDAATRERLEEAMQTSGFLCQPGGTTVNPAILNVLSELSEDDFIQADQDRCRISVNGRQCFKEGLVAAGIPDTSVEEEDALRFLSDNFSLDTTLSLFPPFIEAFTKCQVRLFRERADDCPAWRALAFINVVTEMNDGVLGMRMPLTVSEWEEILDL